LIERILRGQPLWDETPQLRSLLWVIMLMAACGGGYGAVMGSYPLTWEQTRPLQVLYSGLKVPLLLLLTFGLSVPSFYVANLLLGLGDDFVDVLRSVLATQAALTLTLLSLAPFTILFYVSGVSYDQALLVNSALFGLASLSVQPLLRRHYRELIAKNSLHCWTMRTWLVIYAFVGIQMGWVLRPFIGSPTTPTEFFRSEAWGNAYLVIWTLLKNLAIGR
jgi:hypothetical protein